jgi:hypothetical protein
VFEAKRLQGDAFFEKVFHSGYFTNVNLDIEAFVWIGLRKRLKRSKK